MIVESEQEGLKEWSKTLTLGFGGGFVISNFYYQKALTSHPGGQNTPVL